MSEFVESLDRAAQAVICGILDNGGNAAALSAIAKGVVTPGGQVPALAAGLGLLALNSACQFDPNKGTPTAGDFCTGRDQATGLFLKNATTGEVIENWTRYGVTEATATEDAQQGRIYFKFTGYTYPDLGDPVTIDSFVNSWEWSEVSFGPSQRTPTACDLPSGAPVQPPTTTYVDQISNCSIDVTFQSWVVSDDGNVTPVFKMEPTPLPAARAGGGVIGGCNFNPVVYFGGGGGGGGTVAPWEPGPDGPDGLPWWWPIATTAIGNLIAAGIKALVDELLQEREPGRVYRIASVCETNANGEPVDYSREVDIPPLPLLNAAIARLDALEVLLQGHKDFKQPTCSLKPPITGEPVTVRFVSDEPSSAGDRPLRKSFTYLDQSASLLDVHTDHWVNFSWQAGPVCVISKGLPWGVPQVWASTADEGKRVIAHAAQVAGVDLTDPKHEWIVTGSSTPRTGQSGTMRVQWRSGLICVSKRSGPDGRPVLAGPVDP